MQSTNFCAGHVKNGAGVFGCLFVAILVWLASPALGARIYFTDQPTGAPGLIMSVGLDGTEQRVVTTVSNTPDVRGIAYHRASARIYFLDNGVAKRIYSIAPDGGDLQEVVPLNGFNADLEIDEAAGKVYWSETGSGLIRRANLDGTDAETVVTQGTDISTQPYFFFLDPAGGYIYWGVLSGGSGPSNFRRATFAGVVDATFLITTTSRTRDMAVDSASSTAYWCDRQSGTLFKRALSGGVNETVIAGMNAPHGIALDVEARKVYWADTGGRGNPLNGLSSRRIARCNFDGTEFENLSTPMANSEPWDLALDLSSATYAEWRSRFFSTNTPAAGPGDDADGDGARNLLEYAMGTNPRATSSVPRITLQGTSMKYVRRTGSDLQYRVQVSTDLPAFHHNGDTGGLIWTSETSVTPLTVELESVNVAAGSALAGASNVFFRVQASMP